LDGKASAVLQQTVPIAVRKDAGIFFTHHNLGNHVANKIAHLLSGGHRITDPTCGAGDLLLACANYLPIGKTLHETLDIWSALISGYDLYEEFIVATKLRLGLLEAFRSKDFRDLEHTLYVRGIFPGLHVADSLTLETIGEGSIVVNPPFGNLIAPDNCEWAHGKVQKAGVFFETILRTANDGQHIVAILPDVLRSGTRYKYWRQMVSELSSSLSVELKGRFDKEVDIDVFILHVIRGQTIGAIDWIDSCEKYDLMNGRVSDYFDVHVGPVVPHRDLQEGPKYPYIHARTAVEWDTIDKISDERRYMGNVFKPPFVVIHRTSSPSDKNRCVGTIVTGNRKVAVENHLIVLCPKERSLQQCRELIEILKHHRTNEWMNKRICCRHLTVSSVKELPWWPL
jgi:hypothetical protein